MTPFDATTAADERIYPCATCGKLRSKAEGGTVFAVCDACWLAHSCNGPLVAPQTMEACLACATAERNSLRSRLAEVERERDAMRDSLIYACDLQLDRYSSARELRATRETANRLSEPFSHERVQEKYDELDAPNLLAQRDLAIKEWDEALDRLRVSEEQNDALGIANERQVLWAPVIEAAKAVVFERRLKIQHARESSAMCRLTKAIDTLTNTERK